MTYFQFKFNNDKFPLAAIEIKDKVLTLYYKKEFKQDPQHKEKQLQTPTKDKNGVKYQFIRAENKEHVGLHNQAPELQSYPHHHILHTNQVCEDDLILIFAAVNKAYKTIPREILEKIVEEFFIAYEKNTKLPKETREQHQETFFNHQSQLLRLLNGSSKHLIFFAMRDEEHNVTGRALVKNTETAFEALKFYQTLGGEGLFHTSARNLKYFEIKKINSDDVSKKIQTAFRRELNS